MKVITIEDEAYKRLMRKIERIYFYVEKQAEKEAVTPPDPREIRVGNDEAAELLEVSTRTLQRLRSNGEITYSIQGGRTWYTLDEIQRVMAGRLVASKYRQEADLLRAHQDYQKRNKPASTKKDNNPK